MQEKHLIRTALVVSLLGLFTLMFAVGWSGDSEKVRDDTTASVSGTVLEHNGYWVTLFTHRRVRVYVPDNMTLTPGDNIRVRGSYMDTDVIAAEVVHRS